MIVIAFTCSSLGHMCNAALFSGWMLKTLTTGVASNVFCGGFIPIAQTKTTTPTDNLALTLQTKNGRFWEMSCKKKRLVGFQPLRLSRGTLSLKKLRPVYGCHGIWSGCGHQCGTLGDLVEDGYDFGLTKTLGTKWENSHHYFSRVPSLGPSWFMIHCHTAVAGPKTKWGFGSIPSRMPVANEGLGSDSWALTCTSPGGCCCGVGWGRS